MPLISGFHFEMDLSCNYLISKLYFDFIIFLEIIKFASFEFFEFVVGCV